MSQANTLILAMAKHLPPSRATLTLLDVAGITAPVLSQPRSDIEAHTLPMNSRDWVLLDDSADAITAYNRELDADFLSAALAALRPGGRLIVVRSDGVPTESIVRTLEGAGYTRILVEPALDEPPCGLLIRGEKPHRTADTLARIQGVAGQGSSVGSLDDFRGRYVHLLIRQSPNKPVWKMAPDEVITWRAAAVQVDDEMHLLAFSSLPNAVGLMQSAVLAGVIADVNKVAKFSLRTARTWALPVLLNPALEAIGAVTWADIDPTTAEAPDE